MDDKLEKSINGNSDHRDKDEEGRIIIYDVSEIPKNMTESEEHEFWKKHSMSEELMEVSFEEDDDLPPPRRTSTSTTKPISIRIETDLLKRLQDVASIKGVPFQTLLKQFITERVYEEEKREKRKGVLMKEYR
ncbi:MAG TPA: CopG family antitoxin [Bacillaceae bacterium]|nr:CopG family antitoxin [Bacillaceae bacterium]